MSSYPYSVKEIIHLLRKYPIHIIRRKDEKNQRFIYSVNKTNKDAQEFVKNELSEANCVSELLLDRDYSENYLYVFKAIFGYRWCYIKLTIDEYRKRVVVISFHEDEVKKYEKD